MVGEVASSKVPALDASLMAKLAMPLLPAEEVGRDFFGLGPFATRAAVRRGDLPTIRVGRRHYCQTARLREMFGIGASSVVV